MRKTKLKPLTINNNNSIFFSFDSNNDLQKMAIDHWFDAKRLKSRYDLKHVCHETHLQSEGNPIKNLVLNSSAVRYLNFYDNYNVVF